MKKWKKLCMILAAAVVLSLGTASLAYAAEGEIHVNGVGVVMANPDTANISLSVQTTGKTADAAQQESNRILQKVTNALLGLGVAKDNIVTAYTSVYPQYTYNDETGERMVNGYRSNVELNVTTKDIDHTGKYIDAALKAGATGTDGVSFSVADQSVYYRQALQAAVKNAEKSASSIADAYGKALGGVKSITENSQNVYTIEENSSSMAEYATADTASAMGGTTISYGKIQITARIAVTYAF